MNSQNRNEATPEPRAKRPLVKARHAHAPAASLLRNAPNNVGYGEAQASFEDRLRAKGDKEQSVKSASGHLNKFGGWLDAQGLGLRDVREATMDKYVLHRQTVNGVGDICRRRDVIYVKALMKHCLRNGSIARNHLAEYDLPEADKPLSQDAFLR